MDAISAGLGMELQHWLMLLGLLVQAIVLVSSFTWKLASVKEALSADIIEHRDELREAIDAERRAIQESLLAIRQKINDVELEAAKHYVRRESWHTAMNQLQESASKSDQVIAARITTLEQKIDRMVERLPPVKH